MAIAAILATLTLCECREVVGRYVLRSSLAGFQLLQDATVMELDEMVQLLEGAGEADEPEGRHDATTIHPSSEPEDGRPLVRRTIADGRRPGSSDLRAMHPADDQKDLACRVSEELSPGVAAEARIAELRLEHGRAAVRVTGRAKAARSRWTGQATVLRVSYPRRT